MTRRVALRVVGVPGRYSLEEEHDNVSDSDASDVIEVQGPVQVTPAAASSVQPDSTTGIIIQTASDKDKRDYSKKQCCFFCQKSFCKMARHLERAHKNILEIGSLPSAKNASKGDLEKRKRVFTKYRNLGNFNNNIDVLLEKRGIFYVGRRPSDDKHATPYDYLPCPNCLTFLVKGELWRHVKTCPLKNENNNKVELKRATEQMVRSAEYLLKGGLGTEMYREDPEFRDLVMNRFLVDNISLAIKSDKLILLLGRGQLKKLGSCRASQVRGQMRILGRMKIELRSLTGNESADLEDFITTQNFDTCMKAVGKMCWESEDKSLSGTKTFENPSAVLKAGQLLKKVAGLKRGQAVRDRNLLVKEDTDQFISLYNEEFTDAMDSIARHTLAERKYNKNVLLPLTEDLLKYVGYLETTMIECTQSLLESAQVCLWNKLAEVTIARIILFNKKRSSEGAKMLMSQFLARPAWDKLNSELVATLKPIEQYLMKKLSLVEVIGEQDQRVPVLLTPTMVAAIQALMDNREEGGVKSSNPYIFAQGDSDYKKGTECIRRTSLCCNLKCPERITSTKLNKYLATVSQIFNLSESKLGELVRHMGHELSVHRQTYRLQDDVIELAKVSRLLIAVEEGKAAKCAAQSLDDISLEDFDREEDDNELNEDEGDDWEEDIDLDDVGDVGSDDKSDDESDDKSDNEYNSRPTKTTKKRRVGDLDDDWEQHIGDVESDNEYYSLSTKSTKKRRVKADGTSIEKSSVDEKLRLVPKSKPRPSNTQQQSLRPSDTQQPQSPPSHTQQSLRPSYTQQPQPRPSNTQQTQPADQSSVQSSQPADQSSVQSSMMLQQSQDVNQNFRPGRMCIFCHKIIKGGKVKRHIIRHKQTHEEVSEILKKSRAEQNHWFERKRIEGMYEYNMKYSSGEDFMRQRKPKTKDNVRLCLVCKHFISNRTFYRHKRNCNQSLSVPVKPALIGKTKVHKDKDFTLNILNKFRDGELGDLLRTNETIQAIGYRHYLSRKADASKANETRKEIMMEMREIGRLFFAFKDICDGEVVVEDMYTRNRLPELKEAIISLCQKDDGEKHGLKLNLISVFQRSVKILIGQYAESCEDSKKKEVGKFREVFNYNLQEIIGPSRNYSNKRSLKKAQLPQNQGRLLNTLEDFDREEDNNELNEDEGDDCEEDIDLDDVGEQHIGDVESDDKSDDESDDKSDKEYNSRPTKTTKKRRVGDLDDDWEQYIGDCESEDEYNSHSTKTTKKRRVKADGTSIQTSCEKPRMVPKSKPPQSNTQQPQQADQSSVQPSMMLQQSQDINQNICTPIQDIKPEPVEEVDICTPTQDIKPETSPVEEVDMEIKLEVLDEAEALSREMKTLDKFRVHQEAIEEANIQVSKSLSERKLAQKEAHKLSHIQKELSKLDHLLTADVDVIRQKIEESSRDFLDAQKRFDKAEAEYIASKMDLHDKSELKEQLAEQLHTKVHENEVRKANKIADLMRELEMDNLEEEFTLPELPPLSSFQQPVVSLSLVENENILTKLISPTTDTNSTIAQVENNLDKGVTVKTEPLEQAHQSNGDNCNSFNESQSNDTEQKEDKSATGSGNFEGNKCDKRTKSNVDKQTANGPNSSTDISEVSTEVVDTNSLPTDPDKIKVGQTSKLSKGNEGKCY